MGNEDSLEAALAECARSSGGRLGFQSVGLKDIASELGIDLGRSRNPIFDFRVTISGDTFRTVAYTIVLDGPKRPATRVEALGRGLGSNGGKLFELNPFLLVFDYVGKQFMAISAAILFEAFAKDAAGLAKSDTATFSLSPNFKNRTISMYGDMPASAIWHGTLDASLDANALIAGLVKMRNETKARAEQVPAIVSAIAARLAATAAAAAPDTVVVPVPDSPEPSIQIDERVRRMVRTAIRSTSAIILVGPPGTGKTALLREMFREVQKSPAEFGLTTFAAPIWATPDESWTVRDLVGGETIVNGEIQFRPGRVLTAISEDRWLVLDEVNRADMDRIFGGLLTWLSGGTVILGTASNEPQAPKIELGWNTGHPECVTIGIDAEDGYVGVDGKVRYSAGDGWRILGTYNALDAQRVFRFGAALGRRFVRVPIPAPIPELFAVALADHATGIPDSAREGIAGLYAAHFAKEETQLGPAIFLAMCQYVLAATDSPDVAGSLTEAYVVHAGTWLAHLDPRDLDALGVRLQGVLSAEEWVWVTQMVRTLA